MKKFVVIAALLIGSLPAVASAGGRYYDRGDRYHHGGSNSFFGISLGFGSDDWFGGISYSSGGHYPRYGGYGGYYPAYRPARYYAPRYYAPPPPVVYRAPVYAPPPVVVYPSYYYPTRSYYVPSSRYYYGR